jgi:hypothetical protein
MPFVRVFRRDEGRITGEVVFDTDRISRIEVEYAVRPTDPGSKLLRPVDTATGLKDENAVRCYRVFFGGDSVFLMANPNNPVVKIIEQIYNDAVKG